MATMNEDLDFDFSQLDDTLISDQQKQTLLDYINQIKSQKRSINEEFNQFKLSTGSIGFLKSLLIYSFCIVIISLLH
jgi:hypothetical protein